MAVTNCIGSLSTSDISKMSHLLTGGSLYIYVSSSSTSGSSIKEVLAKTDFWTPPPLSNIVGLADTPRPRLGRWPYRA